MNLNEWSLYDYQLGPDVGAEGCDVKKTCDHDGCNELREPTWVFCKEHRLAHVGPTDAEEHERIRADARTQGRREGIEAALAACVASLDQSDTTCTMAIRKLLEAK